MDIYVNLLVALAVGLLIGTERGWQKQIEGQQRLAGIRTFGLVGFFGGLCALLAGSIGELFFGFAFIAFGVIVATCHFHVTKIDQSTGTTTVVALLITFTLGALAVSGHRSIAAGAAVATAFILSLKPFFHNWLRKLEHKEIEAALKLLLISVVLLPILPNEGYGPWNALNPYEIWILVVLISGLSFLAYFAIKWVGHRKGVLLTALLGGFFSSTAVTINLSRLAIQINIYRILAVGILLASGIMFPRIVIVAGIVNIQLVELLAIPMAVMALAILLTSGWLWWVKGESAPDTEAPPLPNPFELKPAVQFGVLLTAIMLLSHLFQNWFGEAGIYILAAGSGLADVDAISLTLARMAQSDLSDVVAVRAIVIAAISNSLVKAVLVLLIAGWSLGRYIILGFSAALVAGVISLFLI